MTSFERFCEYNPTTHAQNAYLDGFHNHAFERAPQVCRTVVIGADDPLDVGRGVTVVGMAVLAFSDARGWSTFGGYSALHRSDGKPLTDRMEEMARGRLVELAGPAPTRADVLALSGAAHKSEDDKARETFERQLETNRRDAVRILEWIEDGRIACER